MALDTTIFADDFAEMIADLPTSVTIGTNSACNAIVTDITDGDTLVLAGMEPDQSVAVHVPVSALTVAPTPGVKVTIGTNVYRAVRVVTTPDGIEYRLDCEAESK